MLNARRRKEKDIVYNQIIPDLFSGVYMSVAPAQTPVRFELAYWAENWYLKDVETSLYGPPQTSHATAKIHVDELNRGAFTSKAYPWEAHPDRFGYPPFDGIKSRKRR